MILEYCASDCEDLKIERAFEHVHVINWFNPEDNFYVLETNDDRAVTILHLLGIEVFIHPENQDSDK